MDVLGVGVSAVDPDLAIAELSRWIEDDEHHYVCVTGVHGIMESQDDPALLEIHNRSGLTVPDGRRICGYRSDGAPLVASAPQEGLVPVDAPIPELCCVRTEVARSWIDRDDAIGAWHLKLGAGLSESGVQVWHVPDLQVHQRASAAPVAVGAGATA